MVGGWSVTECFSSSFLSMELPVFCRPFQGCVRTERHNGFSYDRNKYEVDGKTRLDNLFSATYQSLDARVETVELFKRHRGL